MTTPPRRPASLPGEAEFWIETAAAVSVLLFIPFYTGLIHVGLPGALAYAGLGGAAMAIGEAFQFGFAAARPMLEDVLLWTGAIGGSGGVAYGLALLLV